MRTRTQEVIRKLLYNNVDDPMPKGSGLCVLYTGNFTSRRIYPIEWYGYRTLRSVLNYAKGQSRPLTFLGKKCSITNGYYTVWIENQLGDDYLIAMFRDGEEVSW